MFAYTKNWCYKTIKVYDWWQKSCRFGDEGNDYVGMIFEADYRF